MRHLQMVLYAAAILALLFLVFSAVPTGSSSLGMTLLMLPLSLWTGRLCVAKKTGRITRRMPMLDGGPVREGAFWSFTPDVYVREPGFDYFKGYFVKESLACLLVWVMFLAPVLMSVLESWGIPVR